MPFTIEDDTLLIRGRKGDSASFTFNFSQDISDYTVYFYVQKTIGADSSVIEKKFEKPTVNSITVQLTPEETSELSAQANSYSTYYWGIKLINGDEFAQTIIPTEFNAPPKMYVYPRVGGV